MNDLIPPNDERAERAVIGAMLLSADAVDTVSDLIVAEDYYRPKNATIHAAITAIHGRGEPTDAVAVAAELERRGLLARVGGAPYLFETVESVPVVSNVDYYAAIVAEKALLRRVIEAGTRVAQLGYQGGRGADTESVIEAVAKEMAAIHRPSSTRPTRISDALDRAAEGYENELAPGLPTGLPDLDRLLRMTPGSVTVVAARPGGGKSVFGLQMAIHNAKLGTPSLIATLEMTDTDLAHRVNASEGRTDLSKLVAHELDDAAWINVAKVQGAAKEWPLDICDDTDTGLSKVRRHLADAVRRGEPYGLLVVDYLQLMNSDTSTASRQQEVAALSRGMKLIAKEFHIPVILASQLNRNSTTRQDERPKMSELRESGAIEQDADNIILLHRDDEQAPGEIELIIAKQRQGPSGVVTCVFQGHYQRILSMSKQD